MCIEAEKMPKEKRLKKAQGDKQKKETEERSMAFSRALVVSEDR